MVLDALDSGIINAELARRVVYAAMNTDAKVFKKRPPS